MSAKKTGGKSRRELARKPPLRTSHPLVLIVCEGKETEPNYFNGFRIAKRLPEKRLKIKGLGVDPRTLVDKAVKENKSSDPEFDEIWCVFDCDEHLKIVEARDKAEANGIKIAFSNPSFELWYLLHFQSQNAHIERDECVRLLKKGEYIPGYEKSMGGLYDLLLRDKKQQAAIDRAVALRGQHVRDMQDETSNPSTSVDQLVEYLNTLKGALS